MSAIGTEMPALPDAYCYVMRRKGTVGAVGLIPGSIAQTPPKLPEYLRDFEEVPVYTEQQVRILLAARDAERVDAARLMWMVDRMDTIDCIDIFGSLDPSPARVRAAIDAALQADTARAEGEA